MNDVWEPAAADIGNLDSLTGVLCTQIESSDETLEAISVAYYHLGPVRIGLLSRVLMNNHVVTSLDFTCNGLRDEGCAHVFFALRRNKTVKYVTVAGNEIGPFGAASIADCLAMNKTILKLSLNANELRDEGVVTIAKGLAKNTRMEFLNLRQNDFTDVGAEELLSAIDMEKGNLYLHGLWVNFNSVSPELLGRINEMLKKKHPSMNPTLYQVRTNPNPNSNH